MLMISNQELRKYYFMLESLVFDYIDTMQIQV
jgi:hypothetical protein